MLIVYTGLGCLWGEAGFALRVIRRLAELIAGKIAQRCDTVGFECWRGLFLDFQFNLMLHLHVYIRKPLEMKRVIGWPKI
jgi:hypothetical protein